MIKRLLGTYSFWLIVPLAVLAVLILRGDGLHSVVVGRKIEHVSLANVLIFRADWCHNCPSSAEIAELAEKYKGVAVIEEVNIDKQPDLKAKYHVTKIPFFIVCTDTQCIPMHSISELVSWLNEQCHQKIILRSLHTRTTYSNAQHCWLNE